ncbi:MAG: right-handed parallel beta-helix repeat-containing protein [Phycisphaerales bacterium]|nr:right-handed parallel beta-helix repeat-containing protein [Phycisphaerales bacterium]
MFQITVPDYGDAMIAPTLMTEGGARHENSALEWLGRPNALNRTSVTGEVNADSEATSGDPRVDADGVDNREFFHDRDGRDDGLVFFPLTYEQSTNTGKVQFSIGVADKGDQRYIPQAGEANPNPDRSLFFNLWIDWDTNGVWDEGVEHVLDGVQIQPRNAATWNVINSGASGAIVTCISTSADRNYATFECTNLPTGFIGCGTILARARLDYGENVGRNDPRPLFRSLPSLRNPAAAVGSDDPGAGRGRVAGAARYGEVEDFFIGSDFGDAPDDGFGNFPTLSMTGGGRHLDFHQEWLGVCCLPLATREIDADDDNFVCDGAGAGTDQDGDGNLRPEDTDRLDDGVQITPCGPCGPAFSIDVTVTSSISARGGILEQPGGSVAFPEDDADTLPRYDSEFDNRLLYLTAWADWNGNHNWDDVGEKIIDEAIYPMTFGANGAYTLGEPFTDSNQNGVWDPGEAYVDLFGIDTETFNHIVFPAVAGTDIPQKLWFRFRLNYGEPESAADLGVRDCDEDGRFVDGPRGGALFGEIEDYVIITDDTCWFPRYVSEGDHDFDTSDYHADGPVGPCGGNGPDIWFAYTPTCTGVATAHTCNVTNYDTVIDVYDGVGWPAPNYIDCNDDGPGFCTPQSSITFAVVAGETYSIRVAGKNGIDRGPGLLKIHCKSSGPVLYVNQAVIGGNQSGSDWANAVPTFTRALELAGLSYDPNDPNQVLNVAEIWVAQGVYKPTTDGNRSKRFNLVSGVRHLGGFGGTEVNSNQRNPLGNPTILSGDLLGDDAPCANNADNSYHVVWSSGSSAETYLDGFHITGGNATGDPPFDVNGGGMYIEIGTPRIRNCLFSNNSANRAGGGIYINEQAYPVISYSLIFENCVPGNCGNCGGGGIYTEGGSYPYITNCAIFDNTAPASNGGGVFFRQGPDIVGAVLHNSLIYQNEANAGGGICIALHHGAKVLNCTVAQNSAAQFGGGMFVFRCDPYTANNIFWYDTAPLGAEWAIPFCPSNPDIQNSNIQGGVAAMHLGAAVPAGNCNPNIIGVLQVANPLLAIDLDLIPGSPCIDAGANAGLPGIDPADLDGDGNVLEQTPYDFKLRDRVINNTVDIGAHEVPDNTNPFGACCYADGSCELTTQNGCTGIWMGAGTPCDPNPCPQPPPGACCLPNQTCIVTTAQQCALLGGVFIGPGTICTPSPCIGACCHSDGSCTVTSLSACAAQSGSFQGVGTSCTPNPCSQPSSGACCFDGDICLLLTPVECANSDGTFLGFGASCDPNPCVSAPCDSGDRADSNCDGLVNNFDIDCFVSAIVGGLTEWQSLGCESGACDFLCVNDVNGDLAVNNFDIDPFVTGIVNGGCP